MKQRSYGLAPTKTYRGKDALETRTRPGAARSTARALGAPALLAVSLFGGGLPISTDFAGDAPGAPPSVGGCDEPTTMTVPTGGSILVQNSALGLTDRPVVLSDDDGDYVSLDWHFPDVTDDLVRVEATVSTDSLFNGYFLQTAGDGTAVSTRLNFQSNGNIWGNGVVVGTYAPNTPFRVRVEINVVTQEWTCVIDNELNGFDDDTVHSAISFVNPFVGTVSKVYASLNDFLGGSPRTVAYDDVSIIGVCKENPASAIPRNGTCNFNPFRYTATNPVLGSTWVGTVDNLGSGNFFAGIVGYATPADFCIGAGAVLVNLADPSGELLALPVQPVSSMGFFSLLVQPDINLCGLTVYTQSFGFGGTSPLTLHNAVDLTVGF